MLGGAALTSQLLKPLLAAPRPWETSAASEIASGSWPSGHATAAVALALCAVLIVPRRGVYAAAVAFALAGTEYAGAAGDPLAERRPRRRLRRRRLVRAGRRGAAPRPGAAGVGAALAALVLAAAAAVLVAAASRPGTTAELVQDHTTIAAAAGLLAVACVALVAARAAR